MSLRIFNSKSLFLCYNVLTTKEQSWTEKLSTCSGSIERNTNPQTEHKYLNGFTGLVQLDVIWIWGNYSPPPHILCVYYFCSAWWIHKLLKTSLKIKYYKLQR